MRLLPLWFLTAMLFGCSGSAPTTPSPTPEVTASPPVSEERGGNRGGTRRERIRKFVEEIDANHDGKLSDSERAVGFEKMLQRSARFRKRVDQDGDGVISEKEKKTAMDRFMKRWEDKEEP